MLCRYVHGKRGMLLTATCLRMATQDETQCLTDRPDQLARGYRGYRGVVGMPLQHKHALITSAGAGKPLTDCSHGWTTMTNGTCTSVRLPFICSRRCFRPCVQKTQLHRLARGPQQDLYAAGLTQCGRRNFCCRSSLLDQAWGTHVNAQVRWMLNVGAQLLCELKTTTGRSCCCRSWQQTYSPQALSLTLRSCIGLPNPRKHHL